MKLREIFTETKFTESAGDTEITGICIDSRKVAAGDLYVCIEGTQVDGHSFAADAVARGAAAVLHKKGKRGMKNIAVPRVAAEDTRLALAFVCKRFFGDPSADMHLVGITGTNGKSSTVAFVEEILRAQGQNVGAIGTLGARINGEPLNIDFVTSTTPDTVELYHMLMAMRDAGAKYVVMEVTSHALALHKVAALRFALGLFTNLSQDHLDFHGTMENYRAAKAKLFDLCDRGIINYDDPTRDFLLKYARSIPMITYGLAPDSDYYASDVVMGRNRVSYVIENDVVEVPIPGKFTVYNTLCAYAASRELGFSADSIAMATSAIGTVAGRIQSVPNYHGFTVIVDYAHSPDGLENIINSCREFTENRVITVFGCGGDRDSAKRPLMGEIAGRLSDFCVITSDNPRNEDPDSIIAMVEEGVSPTGCAYQKITDRRDAIFAAIAMADEEDCVIIAGKGHEDYQEFENGRRIHFDDAQVAREALEQ
ncbi:MAG: UDP-N-acetylmuramoyl-L-alanyl-D-glutamate--2,6-diaminopimelate ligase [Clostridiales bacterium]|nr:UDP-N-acetylmuramoyl-L-alanyl-D-glutamate--2,6-diaminopimelate ligase [Clostridiales bacterium]